MTRFLARFILVALSLGANVSAAAAAAALSGALVVRRLFPPTALSRNKRPQHRDETQPLLTLCSLRFP